MKEREKKKNNGTTFVPILTLETFDESSISISKCSHSLGNSVSSSSVHANARCQDQKFNEKSSSGWNVEKACKHAHVWGEDSKLRLCEAEVEHRNLDASHPHRADELGQQWPRAAPTPGGTPKLAPSRCAHRVDGFLGSVNVCAALCRLDGLHVTTHYRRWSHGETPTTASRQPGHWSF